MPSMICKCGKKINYGNIPCIDEWLLVSDVNFDKFEGQVDAELIYREMIHALRCPECKRLWIFEKGFAEEPVEYFLVTSQT